MISIRHIGIYVDDLNKMTLFYKNVFEMTEICSNERDCGNMVEQLLKKKDAEIAVSKLITEYGRQQGTGDMLELIKILNIKAPPLPYEREIFQTGMNHIAFEVNDIQLTLQKIIDNSGEQKTNIYLRNRNKCCFAKDIEGNWIELIERHF